MTTHPLIVAALAMPITHNVVTRFADGTERTLGTRSAASAENYATGERRKIGRELISRATGQIVRVTAVEIIEIST